MCVMSKNSKKCVCSIQPLDFAICELITHLDKLLYGTVKGWTPNNGWLEFELHENGNDFHAIIRPNHWPRASYIRAYFVRRGNGWQAKEGCVHATHLDFQLAFKVLMDSPSTIKSIDINTKEAQLLSSPN